MTTMYSSTFSTHLNLYQPVDMSVFKHIKTFQKYLKELTILIDFSAEVSLAISWTVFEESICLGLSGTIRIYRSILIIEGVIAMNLVVWVTLMALDAGTWNENNISILKVPIHVKRFFNDSIRKIQPNQLLLLIVKCTLWIKIKSNLWCNLSETHQYFPILFYLLFLHTNHILALYQII